MLAGNKGNVRCPFSSGPGGHYCRSNGATSTQHAHLISLGSTWEFHRLFFVLGRAESVTNPEGRFLDFAGRRSWIWTPPGICKEMIGDECEKQREAKLPRQKAERGELRAHVAWKAKKQLHKRTRNYALKPAGMKRDRQSVSRLPFACIEVRRDGLLFATVFFSCSDAWA